MIIWLLIDGFSLQEKFQRGIHINYLLDDHNLRIDLMDDTAHNTTNTCL